jgi:hypothetical protein
METDWWDSPNSPDADGGAAGGPEDGVETFDMPDGGAMMTHDADGDGDFESIASDFDGDGQPEIVQSDLDGDGSLESVDFEL